MSWAHSLQTWDYFSQIPPHYHHNFPTFAWLAVYRSLKRFAEESKLFTLAVFQLVVVPNLQGGKKRWTSEGGK